MVICPNCGSKIQNHKILLLTNLNAITCQVCSSKLQVENKVFFSGIGGVGGAVGAGFGVLLLELFFQTSNMLYLAMMGVLFAVVLIVVSLLVVKFVKLKVGTRNFAWENRGS